MLTQAKRDKKVLSKYKARKQRALKKAEGALIDPSKEALQKLLPFKPIANDKDYEKKFFCRTSYGSFPASYGS